MSDEQWNLDIRPLTALVTGVLPGLGSQVARRLAADGFEVTVCGPEEDTEIAAEEIAQAGRRVDGLAGGVHRLGAVQEAAGRTASRDVLVINVAQRVRTRNDSPSPGDAGAARTDPSEPSRWPLDIVGDLVDREQGIVVQVVPVEEEGEMGGPDGVVTAFESMTHAWAAELGPTGVRVNTVVTRAGSSGDAAERKPAPGESEAGRRIRRDRDVVDVVSLLASRATDLASGTTLCL